MNVNLLAPIPFQGSRLGQSWLATGRTRWACWLSPRLGFEPWLHSSLFYYFCLFIYSPGKKMGQSWGSPCSSAFSQGSLSRQRVCELPKVPREAVMQSRLELGALDSWPTVPSSAHFSTMSWVGDPSALGPAVQRPRPLGTEVMGREQGAQGSGFTDAAQDYTRAELLSLSDKMAA